jgi:hypothetical protein
MIDAFAISTGPCMIFCHLEPPVKCRKSSINNVVPVALPIEPTILLAGQQYHQIYKSTHSLLLASQATARLQLHCISSCIIKQQQELQTTSACNNGLEHQQPGPLAVNCNAVQQQQQT